MQTAPEYNIHETYRLVLEWPSCGLCGADDAAVLHHSTFSDASFSRDRAKSFMYASPDPSRGAIVRCRRCSLVYQYPRDRDVAQLYAAVGEDEFYVASQSDRIATCVRDADRLEKITGALNGKRLLDVGCSYGLFLDVAQARGAEPYGIELSSHQRRAAKERHERICPNELHACGFAPESFDVITLFDVLEHLASPRAFLTDAHRVLARGGWLVLCTPNIESAEARIFRSWWLNFTRMHLYYFSPKTLSALLRGCGFTAVAFEKHKRVIHPRTAVGWMKKRPVVHRLLTALCATTPLGEMKLLTGLSGNMVAYAQKP